MVKQEDKDKDKPASLKDLIIKINKKYGAGTVAQASQARALRVPRMATGIFAVDYAMGGGIPLGRVVGFYGKKSSGKTSLALKTIAASQKHCRMHWLPMVPTDRREYRCLGCGYRGSEEGSICPECKERDKVDSPLADLGDRAYECPECKKFDPFKTVYLDAEGAWENKWAAAMGVDCQHVFVTRTEYAEQAVDVSDALLRTGDVDLLVVDTIAHLTPKVEIEETMEKNQMGQMARLVNKALRKLVSAVNQRGVDVEKRPTILILNQVRMKLGVLYGDPETKPGGVGQEFVTSVDLKMWAGKYTKDDAGNSLYVVLNFRVVKNKTAPSQQEGNFRLWLRRVNVDGKTHETGDVEELEVLLGLAFSRGYFGESPKWNWEGQNFKNKDEVVDYMKANYLALGRVREKLMGDMIGTVSSDDEAMKVKDDDDEE